MQPRESYSKELILNELSVDLKRFIARRITNRADVEDVLQETLFKIHRSIDCLKPDSNIYAWVYRLTRNTIIDYLRRQQTRAGFETPTAEPDDLTRESIS